MPELLLQAWKLVLLGFLYLFFFRVIRAMWATLRTSTRPPAAAPPPRATSRDSEINKTINKLKVLDPPEQRGLVFDLGEELTIGRAPGCRIKVEDTYVSQLHARVFRRENQVLIEDLGSTNGTYCNGNKVAGATPLRKGDRIQVGRTVMEATR